MYDPTMTTPSRPDCISSCSVAAWRAAASPRAKSRRSAAQCASWRADQPAWGLRRRTVSYSAAARSKSALPMKKARARAPWDGASAGSRASARWTASIPSSSRPSDVSAEPSSFQASTRSGASSMARRNDSIARSCSSGVDEVGGLHVAGRAELEMGARVPGVEGHRALEEQHRPVERLVALDAQVQHALGEGLVRLHDVRLLAPAGVVGRGGRAGPRRARPPGDPGGRRSRPCGRPPWPCARRRPSPPRSRARSRARCRPGADSRRSRPSARPARARRGWPGPRRRARRPIPSCAALRRRARARRR